MQTIDDLRQEIARAKFDLEGIQRAPVEIGNLEGQARQYVIGLGREGAPPIIQISKDGQIEIDFTHSSHPIHSHKIATWLDPDQMTKRLVAEIRERQAQNSRAPMSAPANALQTGR